MRFTNIIYTVYRKALFYYNNIKLLYYSIIIQVNCKLDY